MTVFIHSIATWLELVSLAFCIGILVCRLLVFPPSTTAKLPEQSIFSTVAWRLFGVALAIIFVGSAVDLLLRTSSMSGRPVSAVFPVISTVLFRTHYGSVWMIRIASLVLLTFLLMVGAKYRDTRVFLISALLLIFSIAAMRSASGHASDAGDFSIAEIMDWLHIVAASVWGGGLFALAFVILPEIMRPANIPSRLLASVAGRFSRLAGAAVGVLAVTALYNGWLHVGSLKGLWLTSYGIILLIKISLFFLLVNLGAFNRYISVPTLQQLGGIDPGKRGLMGRLAVRMMPRPRGRQDTRSAALRFRRSVMIESVLIVTILLLAAVLVQQVPARHALHAMSGQVHSHSMGDSR